MQALRNHPFFATINWKTLWTDEAPLIEPGLVKKESLQPSNVSIRLAWDQIDDENAIDDDDEEDAASWASNGEGGEYFPAMDSNGHARPALVGPYGETRTDSLPPIPLADVEEERGSSVDGVRFVSPAQSQPSIPEDELRDTVKDILDVPAIARSAPIDVPRAPGPGSHSTGSVSSSSDGSPIEKMGVVMDEAARGRPRAQTPIQGNGILDPELCVVPFLLRGFLLTSASTSNSLMLPGEHIVFNAMVEPGGPKRRASRLLAMAVAPKKHQQQRPRELVLTSHRLLCLKHKPGRAVQVRTELLVRAPAGKEREKDLRSLVTSIEPKGEREFVIITVRVSAVGRSWGAKLHVLTPFPGHAADEVTLLRRRECIDGVDVGTQDPRSNRNEPVATVDARYERERHVALHVNRLSGIHVRERYHARPAPEHFTDMTSLACLLPSVFLHLCICNFNTLPLSGFVTLFTRVPFSFRRSTRTLMLDRAFLYHLSLHDRPAVTR